MRKKGRARKLERIRRRGRRFRPLLLYIYEGLVKEGREE